MSADAENDRMKIEIASNYTTTAYVSMAIFLVTALFGVLAVLLAAIIAKQLQVDQVGWIGVPIETAVILGIIYENRMLESRIAYLDTLIEQIKSKPAKTLGPLKDIMKKVRQQKVKWKN